jgi:Uma2 family endonuclease
MGMAAPTGEVVPLPYCSADMARAFPDDGNRYETVFGELLVSPSPRAWHQEVVARLMEALRDYLRAHPVGHALMSPADISWGPDTLVQPDIFVVPVEQARTMEWSRMRDLLLVVEVLSPATAHADRFTKRRLYQEQGVPLYWIVDPDAGVIECWTPDARFPLVERERIEWAPTGASAPLLVDLAALFRPL